MEYDVYYHFNELNLKKLDLSLCDGTDITIGFIMDISFENLDIYDKNNGFYNDICYSFTNENGNDLTMEDKWKEYVEKNRSLYKENYDFIGYDKNTGRVKCSCGVK